MPGELFDMDFCDTCGDPAAVDEMVRQDGEWRCINCCSTEPDISYETYWTPPLEPVGVGGD